jgi:hypothetical protein
VTFDVEATFRGMAEELERNGWEEASGFADDGDEVGHFLRLTVGRCGVIMSVVKSVDFGAERREYMGRAHA